ncbi:MAG: hypothetical protein KBC58_08105 [Flavobacterium sp.]|nr:hypothetical protein [Flavobacterium sp.]
MKNYVLLALLILVTSCSSQEKIIKESTISASYETWVAGVRGGGSGINFYLELKSELPSNVELKKVIFRGYEVSFEKQDNLHFQAMIKTSGNQQKFEGDDSQIITSPKNALTLAENEAILIFLKSGKEIRQTIKEVKEKPMLLYPSAKPKN